MPKNTKEALAVLTKALKNDKEFYTTWHSSISMAIQDSMAEIQPNAGKLYKAANEAATLFLNRLIA